MRISPSYTSKLRGSQIWSSKTNVAGSSSVSEAGVRSVRPSSAAYSKAARNTNGLKTEPGCRRGRDRTVVLRLVVRTPPDHSEDLAVARIHRDQRRLGGFERAGRSRPASSRSTWARPSRTASRAARCRCRSSVVKTSTRPVSAVRPGKASASCPPTMSTKYGASLSTAPATTCSGSRAARAAASGEM